MDYEFNFYIYLFRKVSKVSEFRETEEQVHGSPESGKKPSQSGSTLFNA